MKRIMAIILLAALLLAGCAGKETTWQEQYDLGVRYLSEGNYDEAILAFQAAIEIDPKNAQAYIGVGDAYAGLAAQSNDAAEKQEYLLSAKDWYEQAKDLGDESAQDKIDQIEEELSGLERPQGSTGNTGLIALTQEHFDYAEEFRNGYAFAIRGSIADISIKREISRYIISAKTRWRTRVLEFPTMYSGST